LYWENEGKINYKFTLEWENGDVGTAMCQKEEGNYEVGAEYLYEKKITEHEGKTYTNFKGVKRADSTFGKKSCGKTNEQFAVEIAQRIVGTTASYPFQYLAMKDWCDGKLKELEKTEGFSGLHNKLATFSLEWQLVNIDKVVEKIKSLL
jgi:hypothetical protein